MTNIALPDLGVTADVFSDALALPLLGERDLTAPLAWRAGIAISAETFLADVAALAARLPLTGSTVNLCSGRYAFAVAFAAALVAGKESVFPPDVRQETLSGLCAAEPDLHIVGDDPALVLPEQLVRLMVESTHYGAPGQGQAGAPHPVPKIPAGARAALLMTSGSTGAPQKHSKRWQTLVQNIAVTARRIASLIDRPSLAGLNIVATVPAQHSYGFESSVLLSMLGGASFDDSKPFFPADIAAALDAVPRPRCLVTTPFHLKTLLRSGTALPPVDLVLCATAPLSPQLAVEAETAFKGALVEIYGSTETGQLATRQPTRHELWTLLDGVQLVPDGDAQAEMAAHRFLAVGGHVAEPTPLADLIERVGNRSFRLLGRANDLVNIAGRRSSLGHLNYHLNHIAGVDDATFWVPDDIADSVVRPVAFVVAPTRAAKDIVAALRERLDAVFVPRRIVHVDRLPRSATGKLTAQSLRALAAEHGISSAVEGIVSVTPVALSDAPPLQGGQLLASVHCFVASDRSVFSGHFPGQPLLPGALILAEVVEAIARTPWARQVLGAHPTLASAKFLLPVRPGTTLDIGLRAESAEASSVTFEVRCGDAMSASGRWISTSP